jgi:alkanesulfonate monooxygenase SsuD/methylene tetrahydromethanopterin reductase-like flavin-dependent oxidoreductase (luciferase family)
VPSPVEAIRFLEGDVAGGSSRSRRLVLGTPASVRTQLEAIADEYGADEIMVLNILYDHAARRRSYSLLAEAFELTPELQLETA